MSEAAQAGGPPEFDESIVQVLASKIFVDWLRNRQQLLIPLTLDLQKIEPAQVDLLVHAMVASAHADGVFEAADCQRIEAALTRLNASDEQRERVARASGESRALRDVLARVHDVQTASMVYAASLLAIDRRKRVNRYYLRYLAERLRLSSDLARTLEQRFVGTS